jgi:DNA-binding response OmpR family regulator
MILYIEDDLKIRMSVETYLCDHGYEVKSFEDGIEAYEFFLGNKVDLVITDLMLPTLNGDELVKLIRNESNVPVVMTTAKGQPIDRLTGLKNGANDYIVKPFLNEELLIRIIPYLTKLSNCIRINGHYELDLVESVLKLDEVDLKLTIQEYNLFLFLVNHPKQLFKRYELLDSIESDLDTSDRVIDVYVKNIRKKTQTKNELIETIYGGGYKFVGDIND